MDYQAFLIKYAEIGIKGKNRYIFEDKLVSRINAALKRIPGDFAVSKNSGRIYAVASEPFDRAEAEAELQTVFGISAICPVVRKDLMPPEELLAAAVDYFGKAHPGFAGSFKVVATRADKSYPWDSQTINYKVGEAVLAAYPDVHVDVHTPDIVFRIEIREKVNFYSETVPGPGGMPVGSSGKAMLLLSGGIDSPVAGWMLAKRCDAVLLTGGVSVGDYDLTPAAMEDAGCEILFRGAAIKPGMACAYGVLDGKPVCGLSGNPASSLTNFYVIALPALRAMAGLNEPVPREITLTLRNGFRKKSPATRILRGRLDLTDGTAGMILPKDQGNVVLSSTVGCDVMAVVPAGCIKRISIILAARG